jgi:hypothetical protein
LLFSCHPSAKREDLLFAFVFNPESASLKTFTHQHLLAIAMESPSIQLKLPVILTLSLSKGKNPRILLSSVANPKSKEATE